MKQHIVTGPLTHLNYAPPQIQNAKPALPTTTTAIYLLIVTMPTSVFPPSRQFGVRMEEEIM